MTLPTTILGRTLPGARQRPEGQAAAGGTPRSEPDQHRLARGSADRPELMTDRVAAQICGVSLRMIRLWVETGRLAVAGRRQRNDPVFRGVGRGMLARDRHVAGATSAKLFFFYSG